MDAKNAIASWPRSGQEHKPAYHYLSSPHERIGDYALTVKRHRFIADIRHCRISAADWSVEDFRFVWTLQIDSVELNEPSVRSCYQKRGTECGSSVALAQLTGLGFISQSGGEHVMLVGRARSFLPSPRSNLCAFNECLSAGRETESCQATRRKIRL